MGFETGFRWKVLVDMALKLSTSQEEDLGEEADREELEERSLAAERDGLALLSAERDFLAAERDFLASERDSLVAERDSLAAERDSLADERNRLTAGHGRLTDELEAALDQSDQLTNLYVATSQLHATLDPQRVRSVISEITINLLGAQSFVLLLREGDSDCEVALVVGSEHVPGNMRKRYAGGDPIVDAVLETGDLRLGPFGDSTAVAVVPLKIDGKTVGALVVFRILGDEGEDELSDPRDSRRLDQDILDVLGAHAATALFASNVYARADQKLRTLGALMQLGDARPNDEEGSPSLSGSLKDLDLADLVQFIHFGNRTGTLRLWRNDVRGFVVFSEGRIVAVGASDQPELCEVASMEPEAARTTVEGEIERRLIELVQWKEGRFEFALGVQETEEAMGLDWAFLRDLVKLNTQMLLLDALRVLDEGGARPAPPPNEKTDMARGEETARPSGKPAEQAKLGRETGSDVAYTDPVYFDLFADEEEFADENPGRETEEPTGPLDPVAFDAEPVSTVADDAKTAAEGWTLMEYSNPFRFDEPAQKSWDLETPLRPQAQGEAFVKGALRTTALEPMLMADGGAAQARRDGDRESAPTAELDPSPGADASDDTSDLENLDQILSEVSDWEGPGDRESAAFSQTRDDKAPMTSAVLQRALGDLSSLGTGLSSSSAAVQAMTRVAEVAERGIFFVRAEDSLVVRGAFGLGADGRELAELLKGLRLGLSSHASNLGRHLSRAGVRTMPLEDAALPESLRDLLGRPRSGSVTLMAIPGSDGPLALIYADNGALPGDIGDLDMLRLLLVPLGLALDNERLRHALAEQEHE